MRLRFVDERCNRVNFMYLEQTWRRGCGKCETESASPPAGQTTQTFGITVKSNSLCHGLKAGRVDGCGVNLDVVQ